MSQRGLRWPLYVLLSGFLTFSIVCLVQGVANYKPHYPFWQLETNGHTLYILGSIHALKEDIYPLPTHIEEAFAQSEQLIVEVDLAAYDATAVSQIIRNEGLFRQQGQLAQLLPPTTYSALTQINTLAAQLSQQQEPKPWLLSLQIMQDSLRQHGFDTALGVDNYFLQKAGKVHKSVRSLEQLEQQLSLFSQLTDLQQVAILTKTLNELGTLNQDMDTLVRAWQRGDLGYLEQVLEQSFVGYPQLYQHLISDRNQRWVTRLTQRARTNTNFVVVGAMHLVGDNSVIQQLQQRGFSVKRL